MLALRKEFEAEEEEGPVLAAEERAREQVTVKNRAAVALQRRADTSELSPRSLEKPRNRKR